MRRFGICSLYSAVEFPESECVMLRRQFGRHRRGHPRDAATIVAGPCNLRVDFLIVLMTAKVAAAQATGQSMKRFLIITMKILLKFSAVALFTMAGLFCSPETALATGQAEHVVVVVWDGMRPDFVSPQYAPTLYSLATNGVFFKNHHSTYVSTTEVNGTALATGMHPSHSGVMANAEYRPEIAWLSPSQIGNLDSVRRGDLLISGKYLLTPTLAEMLQGAGIRTVVAGTKPVALLQDRSNQKLSPAAKESVTFSTE